MAAGAPVIELSRELRTLPKVPTGVNGLDEITGGGLPKGRSTLVCGSAGCGKTLLSMEFLVRGATDFGEPGVFVAFEERPDELAANVASLGFDLAQLEADGKIVIDYIHIDPTQISEAGEYDLSGLFIRLGLAIDAIGAKRLVIDTIETLFGGFTNAAILRAELGRLFHWLKDRGVTAIITGERGDGALTRQGLEEYVADCVILLDHRVTENLSTRRLRIVKYRGSTHGTNEYPFLIDENGIQVLPVTSMTLDQAVSTARISSGIPRLDGMLGGRGYYRGSSVMVSGTAGSGKTSLAAHLADSTCRAGEKVLYFAFEESSQQLARNMRSIGIDLQQWIDNGMLQVHASRPALHGLESHLVSIHKLVRQMNPAVVIIDPLSNFMAAGEANDVRAMLVRLVDFLKSRGVTALFVALTSGGSTERSEVEVSSLIDTWLLVRSIEIGGERNRGLYVLKSRGMAHSNQIREFVLGASGVELIDVYVGPEGVLTGSAREAQEARERATATAASEESRRRQREIDRRRKALEAQIVSLQTEFAALEDEAHVLSEQDNKRDARVRQERQQMAVRRGEDAAQQRDHHFTPAGNT